ncbi:polysaccharide biosynthesis/export family protein [Mesorhizobium sp. AR10]|uniref:polysaccharide biosynthesis/export family protein n=1 Tax=Mesorhizobium sp. AR10 TaxID=2865839 RepID=UPI002160A9CD|nr:polysaccharide biosynthesis/export family protein [Mesorhizobium sp. AR10]UVK37852.1 polysaccharide biosynthesis/export family protein [Mesorhizobium sp. AR10]
MAALLHGTRKRSRGATISLIPFCLILLFGAPARGQSETDDRLVPQDTVEVNVSGWGASRGGVTEGAELNGAFAIDTAGTLDLPVIGPVPAGGLYESALAKLITNRLQARSGFGVRPVATVRRTQSAASSSRAKVEGHPPGALPDVNGTHPLMEAAATGPEPERSKLDASLDELSDVRKELEAARQEAPADRQSADGVERVLRSELEAARKELDQMRRAQTAADATTLQGRRALEAQQQRAERLALNLAMARREVESLQTKAIVAIREKIAALGAQLAAQASLAEARRALDEERQKVERFERDLAAAHQSLDALVASGKRAAAALVAGSQGRQVAEAAAKRAEEALALERKRADALALDVNAASQDRDAAKEEVARLFAALEQQRETAVGLARNLTAARNEIDILKARDAPRAQRVEPAPKARVADRKGPRASALARKLARSVREPERREIRKAAVRTSPRVATITLPAALLPTRAPLGAAQGVW